MDRQTQYGYTGKMVVEGSGSGHNSQADQGTIGRRPGAQGKTLGIIAVRVNQFDVRLVGRRSGGGRRGSGRRRGGSRRRSGSRRRRGRSDSFGGPGLTTGAAALRVPYTDTRDNQ